MSVGCQSVCTSVSQLTVSLLPVVCISVSYLYLCAGVSDGWFLSPLLGKRITGETSGQRARESQVRPQPQTLLSQPSMEGRDSLSPRVSPQTTGPFSSPLFFEEAAWDRGQDKGGQCMVVTSNIMIQVCTVSMVNSRILAQNCTV